MKTIHQVHVHREPFPSLHDLHLATFRANRDEAMRRRLVGTGNRIAARLRALGRYEEARAVQSERMRALNEVRNHG